MASTQALRETYRAERTLAELKASAPAVIREGDAYVNEYNLEKALQCYSMARDLDPGIADSRWKRGNILQTLGRFPEACEDYAAALKLDPVRAKGAAENLELCRELMLTNNPRRLVSWLISQARYPEAYHVVVRSKEIQDKRPFFNLFARMMENRLECLVVNYKRTIFQFPVRLIGSALDDLTLLDLDVWPVSNLILATFDRITDLTPLRKSSVRILALYQFENLSDLSPLAGLPLTDLILEQCPNIIDLKPLKGMPLKQLSLSGCSGITDLSPLKGMALQKLDISGCSGLVDYQPLRELSVKELVCDDNITAEQWVDVLAIKGLMRVNGLPAEEYRLRDDEK